jgi:hypothetical protein
MQNIHTLNARDNSVLPWLFDYFGEDPHRFREGIQRELAHLSELLHSRNVEYSSLKSALIPPEKGVQVAFFYDWMDDPSWNYAVAFAEHWMPLLRGTLRTSVKSGDLLAPNRPDFLLDQQVHRTNDLPIRWDTQYAVYFNNLKQSDVEHLHKTLSSVPRYRGYVDVSLASPVRNYIARCLSALGILHTGRVILSHGGDEPQISNEDPVGFPYKENGFEVVSLLDGYFNSFLDYKIESDSSSKFRVDTSLALAAVTGELINLEEVEIFVHQRKLDEYLFKDSKLEQMTRIGLGSVTPLNLANSIRERLQENYIYDLRIKTGPTPTFAVSAEFARPDGSITRRLLALKYDAPREQIALVSMY